MKYTTAIFSYTPPLPVAIAGQDNADGSRDPQAVQAALSQLVQEIRQRMEARLSSSHVYAEGLVGIDIGLCGSSRLPKLNLHNTMPNTRYVA